MTPLDERAFYCSSRVRGRRKPPQGEKGALLIVLFVYLVKSLCFEAPEPRSSVAKD